MLTYKYIQGNAEGRCGKFSMQTGYSGLNGYVTSEDFDQHCREGRIHSPGEFIFTSESKDAFQNKNCRNLQFEVEVMLESSVKVGNDELSSWALGAGGTLSGTGANGSSRTIAYNIEDHSPGTTEWTQRGFQFHCFGSDCFVGWSSQEYYNLTKSWYGQSASYKRQVLMPGTKWTFIGISMSVNSYTQSKTSHTVRISASCSRRVGSSTKTYYFNYSTFSWQTTSYTESVPIQCKSTEISFDRIAGLVSYANIAALTSSGLEGTQDNNQLSTIWKTTEGGHNIGLTEVVQLIPWHSIADSFLEDCGRAPKYQGLTPQCLGNLTQFSGNAIAYISDLKAIGSSVRTIVGLLTSKKFDAKSLSRAWLSLRYGDRLTIMDSIELMKGATSHLPTSTALISTLMDTYKGSARGHDQVYSTCPSYSTIDIIHSQTAYVTPKDDTAIEKMVRLAMMWDAWPSLENMWDLIPLSFVVDWVVNVGDILDSFDMYVYSMYYRVLSVTRGFRAEAQLNTRFITEGNTRVRHAEIQRASVRYYRRTRHAQLPSFDICNISVGNFSSINLIDAASLIVSLA